MLGSHLIIKSAVSAIILVAEAGSIMTERHNSNIKLFSTGDVNKWFQQLKI